MEWRFYEIMKLFLKDINTDIIYWGNTNWGSQAFCIDAQFYTGVSPPIYVPTASF